MFKRAAVLCISIVLFLFGTPLIRANAQPEVAGKYAISIDAMTGDVLFDKEAHQRAFPASMTKVLTAILLMEHVQPGEQIAFSQQALAEEKSNYQIEFQAGEMVDRDTALMILMVLSANDMAYAIAEHVAGNVEAFSVMMNEKARELGAKDSNFVTPSGLHDVNHYTTAYDMAMIARSAMKYPEIMHAMITKRTTVTTSRQTASIFNKAKFFQDPNCIGGKTGFTDQARNTLVLINKKDDREIINVVMASYNPGIYNDMKVIADYAFPQFAKQTLLDKNTWTQDAAYLDKSVAIELERSAELVLKQGEGQNVEAVYQPLHFENEKLYTAGIQKGEVLGQVDLVKNGVVLDSVSALAKDTVIFEKPVMEKVVETAAEKGSVFSVSLVLLSLLAASFGMVWRKRKRQYSS